MNTDKPKPPIPELPLEELIEAVKAAGQRAARDALAAGHVVAGWEDGKMVHYGPGPLGICRIEGQDRA